MPFLYKQRLQSVLRPLRWISPIPQGQSSGRVSEHGIASLDGVRAAACLIVIAYHINLITRDTHIWNPANAHYRLLTSLILSGYSGVTLFFVLSGFLLFLPYARALLFSEAWPSMRHFYLRRALRIIPAYYVTLFLLLLFPALQPQPLPHISFWDIGLFLTFLMDATRTTFQQINGPFWTLAVEWQFYILLPVLAMGIRFVVRSLASPQRRCWAAGGCLIVMIAWAILWRTWGNAVNAELALHSHSEHAVLTPIQRVLLFCLYGEKGKFLEDFAVGMLICLIYVFAQHTGRDQFAPWLEKRWPWLWVGGIWLLFYEATSWPWSPFPVPAYNASAEFLYSCGYGLCILAILFNRTTLQRCFSWKPLCALGRISYSLYMWHLPLLVILMGDLQHRMTDGNRLAIYALYWLYVSLVIVPFCANFFRFFERPGIQMASRIKKRTMQSTGIAERASKE